MDPGNAIELLNVSKTFTIGANAADSGLLKTLKRSSVKNTVFDNFSLNVKKGEILGIIGRNGCGKSTLLSIIAHIMEPDSGHVNVCGKVASILALTMGFHQDMSGRENIYLRGELYGLSKKQIDLKIESIIDFSGIGEYIDAPVRTYSSGMRGRLAFAIMINVEADVLLVDEVLSTGDVGFSAKASRCFKNLLKEGKSVVFVSHNLHSLIDICTRAIWIEKGKIIADGNPKKVCTQYSKELSESVDILTDFSNAGVADAQYKLAMMYKSGDRVEENIESYKRLIKESAQQGYSDAEVEYANMLMSEDINNSNEAMLYYLSAAKKGNNLAKQKIAAIQNKNSDDDKRLLLNLCEEFAKSGNPGDISRYADFLYKTAQSDEDFLKVYSLYSELSKTGDPEAYYMLAVMNKTGQGVTKNLDKYVEYLKKASDCGHLKSSLLLSEAYDDGSIVERDEGRSFQYLLKCAQMGNIPSQFSVAIHYLEGKGVERNIVEAESWFSRYSTSQFAPLLYTLSEKFTDRSKESNEMRITLLEKAGESYYYRALVQLAELYRQGIVVQSDLDKARHYYLEMARWPGKSRFALAQMYCSGELFNKDLEKAQALLSSLLYYDYESVTSMLDNIKK